MELNVQRKMIKPLGKNTGNNPQDLRLHKMFLMLDTKSTIQKKNNE